MKKIFFSIWIFIISCNNSKTNLDINSTTHEINNKSESLQLNSNQLIDSLYKDVTILRSLSVDSFRISHKQNKNKDEIEVNCSAYVNDHNFGYIMILADTAKNYNKLSFEPSNAYLYKASKLFLDGNIINITNEKYVNEQDIVDPVIVWYGKDFGSAAKYYELADRDIYLIRGINFYCNGSNCMNYKILLIQKNKKNSSVIVRVFDFPGNYPYSFENTFLFTTKNNPIPKMYIIKKGKIGAKLSDFQMVNIE